MAITPSLRQLIEKKLARLDRVLNNSAVSAQAILRQEKFRRVAELTIHARGDHMLHGLGRGANWPTAVKDAVEKISQQAYTLKGKWTKRKRRASGTRVLPTTASAPPAGGDASPVGHIVRASGYVVKPMSVEDAALTFGTGAENFLVFRNATTEAVNILYRRKDGNLGLIEPEA